jgi:hypothetical protein
MTENQEKDIMDMSETYCYTYEVSLVVQIIAPNKEIADARLDKDGGYISKRDVKFLDSIFLYKSPEEKTNETEETDK